MKYVTKFWPRLTVYQKRCPSTSIEPYLRTKVSKIHDIVWLNQNSPFNNMNKSWRNSGFSGVRRLASNSLRCNLGCSQINRKHSSNSANPPCRIFKQARNCLLSNIITSDQSPLSFNRNGIQFSQPKSTSPHEIRVQVRRNLSRMEAMSPCRTTRNGW